MNLYSNVENYSHCKKLSIQKKIDIFINCKDCNSLHNYTTLWKYAMWQTIWVLLSYNKQPLWRFTEVACKGWKMCLEISLAFVLKHTYFYGFMKTGEKYWEQECYRTHYSSTVKDKYLYFVVLLSYVILQLWRKFLSIQAVVWTLAKGHPIVMTLKGDWYNVL